MNGTPRFQLTRQLWLGFAMAALAGCGGGGGDGAPPPAPAPSPAPAPTPPTAPPAAVAPTITTAPSAATADVGQTATFSVVASGTAPLGYQWRRNGAAIAGATAATYVTPALTLADSGAVFAVTVSNSAGSLTSAGAALTVAAPVAATSYLLASEAGVPVASTATVAFADGNASVNRYDLVAFDPAGTRAPATLATAGNWAQLIGGEIWGEYTPPSVSNP